MHSGTRQRFRRIASELIFLGAIAAGISIALLDPPDWLFPTLMVVGLAVGIGVLVIQNRRSPA